MPSIHTDQSLFNRFLAGELSPGEADALMTWLGTEQLDPAAVELLTQQLKQPVAQKEISPAITAALDARLSAILKQSKEQARLPVLKNRWLKYAAAVIVLIGAATIFLLYQRSTHPEEDSIAQDISMSDIPAGKPGAILTLADGSTVVLDSLGNGVIATQNGTKVLLDNGQLVYNTDGAKSTETSYNTIVTPRGRQFQLVLPDQTKVWLNAASSLRYPTVFTGKERTVEITGEAYFEVAKNAKMPFHVKINSETGIEVLGTHFNVNSYDNESSLNTTLLEGSVRVSHKGEKTIIKPGQQAQVSVGTKDRIKVVDDVDVEKVMAWKNGVFDFQDATLQEVMHQLERWYDIEVVYEKGVPPLEFVGKMGRDLSLSNVIRGLELSKVHLRLEGRKLIVMP